MLARVLTVIVSGLLAAVLVGCSGGQDSPSGYEPLLEGEPALDPAIIASADPASFPRPLWAYRYSDAEAKIVSRARTILSQRCMEPFGFAPAPGWEPEGLVLDDYRRYGLWDPAGRQNGYWGRDLPDGSDTSLPVPYVGIDESNVYFGMVNEFNGLPVPPGGCAAAEANVVPADLQTYDFSLVGNLDGEAQARAKQDSRVVPLLDAWRACMRDKGWDYDDVEAPFQYWAEDGRRGGEDVFLISDDELRNAEDDLDCKESTGLQGTWLAADIAYQEVIIERDGERLREFRQALERIIANANQIIAEG